MPKLNGWKEIASHLGKSVRTVQRWEREYRLPVHRVGREGGEIIWAESDEIEAWLRSKDATDRGDTAVASPDLPAPAPPAPPRWRSGSPVWLAVATAVIGVLAIGYARQTVGMSAGPTDWRVVRGVVEALSDDGRVLWSHAFPSIRPEFYPRTRDGMHFNKAVIADLDSDGRRDIVLTVLDPEQHETSGLYVFGPDGRRRFDPVRPSGSVRFGDDNWTGPWSPHRVWVLREGGESFIYASFVHLNQFPTLLLALTSDGREVGRYWSAGYIRDVRPATWNGRRVLLVGATNNDTRGASLAIFPAGALSGSAPAINSRFRCTSCGDGGPLEFLIFPRRCMSRQVAGQAHVDRAHVEEGGRIHVHVTEGPSDAEDNNPSSVWYAIDHRFRTTALVGAGLLTEHRDQFARGQLDHPFGDRDERDLFPVLRWNGSEFVALASGMVWRQGS
ncbi:MAG TPA: helix-turn-helix domain-containing protein [Vicinamibacterales bacterium]|nr:helix-turn-helix domain-containing protein [Vicinamibacterales bacterium]